MVEAYGARCAQQGGEPLDSEPALIVAQQFDPSTMGAIERAVRLSIRLERLASDGKCAHPFPSLLKNAARSCRASPQDGRRRPQPRRVVRRERTHAEETVRTKISEAKRRGARTGAESHDAHISNHVSRPRTIRELGK